MSGLGTRPPGIQARFHGRAGSEPSDLPAGSTPGRSASHHCTPPPRLQACSPPPFQSARQKLFPRGNELPALRKLLTTLVATGFLEEPECPPTLSSFPLPARRHKALPGFSHGLPAPP